MTNTAYVLIETQAGKTQDVVEALLEMETFTAADKTTGPYDVIAFLDAPDLDSINDVVSGQLHTISGITRFATCLNL